MEYSDGNYTSVIQLNFFIAEDKIPEISISGLTYIPNFITTEEYEFWLPQIDQQS